MKMTAWRRLLCDEYGQDVIEYALLTASIGVMGVATWPAIVAAIGNAYQQLDTQTQDLWEVPDPGSN
jgi:Flp pilus assembly pilin Flp